MEKNLRGFKEGETKKEEQSWPTTSPNFAFALPGSQAPHRPPHFCSPHGVSCPGPTNPTLHSTWGCLPYTPPVSCPPAPKSYCASLSLSSDLSESSNFRAERSLKVTYFSHCPPCFPGRNSVRRSWGQQWRGGTPVKVREGTPCHGHGACVNCREIRHMAGESPVLLGHSDSEAA